MSINSINSTTNANAATTTSAASTATAASATVDYNEFLQLLVAELQNQDPTNPADPTQYMSQLASFSSVEQQVQTNSTLDSLLAAQAGGLVGQYGDIGGRHDERRRRLHSRLAPAAAPPRRCRMEAP